MENDKPIKVEFAPGAFDNFDGTQEELDELMAEIHRMVETGEIFEKSRPVDLNDLDSEEDAELIKFLTGVEEGNERKLQ
ncbi:hypothetical protein UFOVP71_334 [uncultured Caudovirales phage]|uniref:Uncharacterized protein n=1 Tax=uncultured Caudovirales phage TaxID=2100421 RepID=A0A6J5TA50_9CAUD|nr:hypothetical protein UFOVP71_334 [uncultured Caudovirales phage]